METFQTKVQVGPFGRGIYLITDDIKQTVIKSGIKAGLVNVFCQHTSASLTINENSDPDVRSDLEKALNILAPENGPWDHVDEGSDDMPAHIKSSLLSTSLVIPVAGGRLGLGTWQGVYFCEHRNSGGARTLLITIQGKS